MSETVLYAAPGTCARVPAIVLEEMGMAFETRVIRFLKGEHKSLTLRVRPVKASNDIATPTRENFSVW
jgi:glutathione S-transferase